MRRIKLQNQEQLQNNQQKQLQQIQDLTKSTVIQQKIYRDSRGKNSHSLNQREKQKFNIRLLGNNFNNDNNNQNSQELQDQDIIFHSPLKTIPKMQRQQDMHDQDYNNNMIKKEIQEFDFQQERNMVKKIDALRNIKDKQSKGILDLQKQESLYQNSPNIIFDKSQSKINDINIYKNPQQQFQQQQQQSIMNDNINKQQYQNQYQYQQQQDNVIKQQKIQDNQNKQYTYDQNNRFQLFQSSQINNYANNQNIVSVLSILRKDQQNQFKIPLSNQKKQEAWKAISKLSQPMRQFQMHQLALIEQQQFLFERQKSFEQNNFQSQSRQQVLQTVNVGDQNLQKQINDRQFYNNFGTSNKVNFVEQERISKTDGSTRFVHSEQKSNNQKNNSYQRGYSHDPMRPKQFQEIDAMEQQSTQPELEQNLVNDDIQLKNLQSDDNNDINIELINLDHSQVVTSQQVKNNQQQNWPLLAQNFQRYLSS